MKKMMKAIGSILTLSLLLAWPVYAQQLPKVAAVDLQRAFEQSAEGKNVLTQLKQKEQSIMSELDKFDKQILSLETRIKAQSLTLTYEAQQKLALELDSMRTQRKRVEEDSAKDFQRLQFTLVSRLRNEVLSVIQGYAREQQISLVFDLSAPSALVFCEPALDITSEIIKRYDATKLTVK